MNIHFLCFITNRPTAGYFSSSFTTLTSNIPTTPYAKALAFATICSNYFVALTTVSSLMSTINCSNLVHLCLAVPEILDWEIWKVVYKMAASGRTEVTSDVKFGDWASFIELAGPNLVILALMVSKRSRRRDGDGDGDDDGVRGLCHKRLRQHIKLSNILNLRKSHFLT